MIRAIRAIRAIRVIAQFPVPLKSHFVRGFGGGWARSSPRP
ncbi:hypothetical protein [Streptomyces sp. 8P21H-1]|nr:hypothetical protein [Streptomyces sp. 8P21H-1]